MCSHKTWKNNNEESNFRIKGYGKLYVCLRDFDFTEGLKVVAPIGYYGICEGTRSW